MIIMVAEEIPSLLVLPHILSMKLGKLGLSPRRFFTDCSNGHTWGYIYFFMENNFFFIFHVAARSTLIKHMLDVTFHIWPTITMIHLRIVLS